MSAASFDQAFEDIKAGGSLRWKQGELVRDWEMQHANIERFVKPNSERRVLVPLAGDCAYVKHGWEAGFHMTAVEWSTVAVSMLRKQFESAGVTFSVSTDAMGKGSTVYEGERIRLVVASWEAYAAVAEEESFDVIFDKDAFGYLGVQKGGPYAAKLCELLKPGGHVYLEVKNRKDGGAGGPPFHISAADIKGAFGARGTPIVHDFGVQPADYGTAMIQVAFMLRKEETA